MQEAHVCLSNPIGIGTYGWLQQYRAHLILQDPESLLQSRLVGREESPVRAGGDVVGQ